MIWRKIFVNMLAIAALGILAIEVYEFALLAYVWLVETPDKLLPSMEYDAVMTVTVVTLTSGFVLVAALLISIVQQRVWPSFRLFGVFASFFAVTQLIFWGIGKIEFGGDWPNDFFQGKSPSFAYGAGAACMLTIICIVIRSRSAMQTEIST